MTEMEKRRIVVMRSAGESYKTIADKLQLPVNTVKTYCRRRRLENYLRVQLHMTCYLSEQTVIVLKERPSSAR